MKPWRLTGRNCLMDLAARSTASSKVDSMMCFHLRIFSIWLAMAPFVPAASCVADEHRGAALMASPGPTSALGEQKPPDMTAF